MKCCLFTVTAQFFQHPVLLCTNKVTRIHYSWMRTEPHMKKWKKSEIQPCLWSTHNLQEILQLFLFQAILICQEIPLQELKLPCIPTSMHQPPATHSVSFATDSPWIQVYHAYLPWSSPNGHYKIYFHVWLPIEDIPILCQQKDWQTDVRKMKHSQTSFADGKKIHNSTPASPMCIFKSSIHYISMKSNSTDANRRTSVKPLQIDI